MLESKYQAGLIKRLQRLYPGCVVLKNDPAYIQGFPDLTVFCGDRWGVLEVKASINSPEQPNQAHWVDHMHNMSYGSFICPETEEGVLYELQQAFGAR